LYRPQPASLGPYEFGEMGIDLSDAFLADGETATCETWGQVEAVSRSSSNSGISSLGDLLGPGQLSNCGDLVINKVTAPSPDPSGASFDFTVTGPSSQPTDAISLPDKISLKNGESSGLLSVGPGTTYSIVETMPPGWQLSDASCTNGVASTGTPSDTGLTNIAVDTGQVVTCTFTNTASTGALQIVKTSTGSPAIPLGGATFSITCPGSYSKQVTTGGDGTTCVDQLEFGEYQVQEIAPPPNYAVADTTPKDITINLQADCTTSTADVRQVGFADAQSGAISVSKTEQVRVCPSQVRSSRSPVRTATCEPKRLTRAESRASINSSSAPTACRKQRHRRGMCWTPLVR
jgi:hypothetical protein